MADSVSIDVDSRDFQEALKKIIKEVDASELSMAGAEVIFDISQRLVPVDTGELKASGKVEKDGEFGKISYGTDHAYYVEYGTSKQAAQPYLRPAADKHTEITKGIVEKLKDQVY